MSAIIFDATQEAPNTGGGPIVIIPEGEQTFVLVGSEKKPNSAGNGTVIEINAKVQGGDYNGHVIKEWLNFENPSAEAQRIGRGDLSAICHAVGVLKPTSTEQLHGRPFKAWVSVKSYERENRTTKLMETKHKNTLSQFSKLEGATAGAPVSAPPSFITQPTAPPVAQPAPPVAAPVAPPVQPTPPPVLQPAPTPPVSPIMSSELYYVAHKGANITPVPVSSTEVFAMNLPPNEVMICVNGGSDWKPLASLVRDVPATPAPTAGTPPPWARP